MTNKSILERLAEHEAAGRLVAFKPIFDLDETERRRIWMLPGLHAWLYETGLKKADRDTRANIRTTLGRFVKGYPWNNCDDMKLLEPYDRDLWELRIRFTPQTRIFGALACFDTFVCTNKAFRDDLKKKGSPQWLAAEAEAMAAWEELFPGCRRYHGRPFENCISGGFDLCNL